MAETSEAELEALLAPRLEAALASYKASAPPGEVDELMKRLDTAHAQAAAASRGEGDGAIDEPELAWANTYLGKATLVKEAKPSHVNSEGGLVGFHKYEKLDIHLLETLIQYLEHPKKFRSSFVGAREITLPKTTSLAIAGDWATGYWQGDATAGKRVADRMLQAEYTIHLGDTYYAGRPWEIDENLGLWPKAKTDYAFAIRGNHEMYCKGGKPFMQRLPKYFPAQNGVSCFAMSNEDWLVLALDTAYFAKPMFLSGTLGPKRKAQWTFAADRLKEAKSANRKVILLTHHAPFNLVRTKYEDLHHEVHNLFRANRETDWPDLWAWGHLHNAAVYANAPGKFRGRLIGHGAYPFGCSSDLAKRQCDGVILWHETVNAGDQAPYELRVTNGFLRIDLNGRDAHEAIWAESGDVPRWKADF